MSAKFNFVVRLNGYSDSPDFSFLLPREIIFYSNWKVGLTQCFLDFDTFSNFTAEDRSIFIRKKGNFPWDTKLLPKLCYESISKLLAAITNVFDIAKDEYHKGVSVQVKGEANLIQFDVKDEFELRLSHKLYTLLGIPLDLIIQNDYSLFFKYHLNLTAPRFDLYCNVIDASVHNDSYEPILRTFSLPPSWSKSQMQKEFSPVEYHSISTSKFRNLKFTLKQTAGEPILFQSCELGLTLDFRRVS